MKKRKLVLIVGFLGTILWLTVAYSAYVDPETKLTPKDAISLLRSPSHPPVSPDQTVIGPAEEIRGVLGTPGKNVVASPSGDGDTVQAIWGAPSGNPNEMMELWYAISTDGGGTWTLSSGQVSTRRARRLYPAIEQLLGDTLRVPHIAWHEGRAPAGTYLRHPLYWTWDDFHPFMIFGPVCIDPADSATIHFWFPSLELSEFADTILISAANINQSGSPTLHNAYLWRSFDGGSTWEKLDMIDTQARGKVDIDSPLITKGPGGYIFAYFEWGEEVAGPPLDTIFLPWYMESFDCGETWSAPDSLGVPYDSASSWWYTYDVLLDESDAYRPHVAIKFSPQSFEFSDVWELHPYSGSMGSWSNWQYTLLAGDQYGAERLATQPSIGRVRGTSQIYVTFSYFSDPALGQLDIGMRCSTDGGQTWDPTLYQITNDAVAEEAVELAYQVSNYLHIVYLNDRDAPTQFMHLRYGNPHPGVEEGEGVEAGLAGPGLFQNRPNPFSTTTTISYQVPHPSEVSIRVYDLTGKLVRSLVSGKREAGAYSAVWDRRADDGTEASSGVYFYRLSTGTYSEARKMVLLR